MVAIAILDDYQNVALRLADWSRLQDTHRVHVFNTPFADEAAAAKALVGFDVLAIMRERTRFPASLIEKLPILKLIVTSGGRNDAIDVAASNARGITVSGTDSPGFATAELTWGLILGLARNIAYEDQRMRDGHWQTTVGRDLRGKTLGLIGLGRLGKEVAGFAKAFRMNVIAWSANLKAEEAAAVGVERVEKADLFRRADFISIHTRLSERTKGLVGAAELALMKPTAYIVNTSRGPIIDEAALMAALEAGRIAGAGLDVYGEEPLPATHMLRSWPRTLLTPHLGYVTEETYRVFYGGMVEAIEGWLAGKPVRVIKP